QTYDRDLADVFAIQSEIAKAIADQLQAKLSPNEKKAIEQPPTTDLAAFDLYSRRSHFCSRQVLARRASQTCGRQLNFWMKRSSAIPHFSMLTASSPMPTNNFMQ